MGKEAIDRNLLKKLLNETRNDRTADAIKLNAYELMQKYRGLLDEDLVTYNFNYRFLY